MCQPVIGLTFEGKLSTVKVSIEDVGYLCTLMKFEINLKVVTSVETTV